jgi:hypothetical protein
MSYLVYRQSESGRTLSWPGKTSPRLDHKTDKPALSCPNLHRQHNLYIKQLPHAHMDHCHSYLGLAFLALEGLFHEI